MGGGHCNCWYREDLLWPPLRLPRLVAPRAAATNGASHNINFVLLGTPVATKGRAPSLFLVPRRCFHLGPDQGTPVTTEGRVASLQAHPSRARAARNPARPRPRGIPRPKLSHQNPENRDAKDLGWKPLALALGHSLEGSHLERFGGEGRQALLVGPPCRRSGAWRARLPPGRPRPRGTPGLLITTCLPSLFSVVAHVGTTSQLPKREHTRHIRGLRHCVVAP